LLGIESTVIGFDGKTPVLLRPGAIPRERSKIWWTVAGPGGAAIQAPGMMSSHYARAPSFG